MVLHNDGLKQQGGAAMHNHTIGKHNIDFSPPYFYNTKQPFPQSILITTVFTLIIIIIL